MRVLLVDDEEMIIEFLRRALAADGHLVDHCYDGAEAVKKAAHKQYDIIILDVLMPEKDGLTVCREVRAMGIAIPILILSTMQAAQDRVSGLDSGADDYLIKPFTYEELAARLRALMRRPREVLPAENRHGIFTINPARRVVEKDGIEIDLTPREFTMLEYLFLHRNRAVSKEELLAKLWGVSSSRSSNRVEVCVRSIREKLGTDGEHFIQTVRGFGYMIGK